MFPFQALAFQKINRLVTSIDSQPMFDGGVLINVLGRLQVCAFQILLKNCIFIQYNLS